MSVEGKVYLRSMGVPEDGGPLLELLDQPPEKTLVTVVPTAKHWVEPGVRDQLIRTQIDQLGRLGLEDCRVLDLHDYVGKNGKELGREMRRSQLWWFLGGETYGLLQTMEESGFTEELPEVWESGELIFSGYSAPSIAAGPELPSRLDECDEPRLDVLFDNEQLKGKRITKGLGLVPVRIVPHADSELAGFAPLVEAAAALPNRDAVLSPTGEMVTLTPANVALLGGGVALGDSEGLVGTGNCFAIHQSPPQAN